MEQSGHGRTQPSTPGITQRAPVASNAVTCDSLIGESICWDEEDTRRSIERGDTTRQRSVREVLIESVNVRIKIGP